MALALGKVGLSEPSARAQRVLLPRWVAPPGRVSRNTGFQWALFKVLDSELPSAERR